MNIMPIEYTELGEKIISNITLEIALNELRKQIHDVYKDTSESHINSALQALDSVSYSQFPLGELLSILDNLRTACNLLERVLEKKRKVAFFFEKDELSTEEKIDVNKKLGVWYAAQAIVLCLTTKGNVSEVGRLLDKAFSFYKTSLLISAKIRNNAGYEEYEGIQIVNDLGEFSCSHEEVYSHRDYSSEEKAEYIQLQIEIAESWDKKNRELIHEIGI